MTAVLVSGWLQQLHDTCKDAVNVTANDTLMPSLMLTPVVMIKEFSVPPAGI